jgi:branched-chain amino acid aminotransferase
MIFKFIFVCVSFNAGNYGPTLAPSKKAGTLGCAQVLWLFGPEHHVTEVGAMNFFFVFKKKGSDRLELVTGPLTRGGEY